MEGRVEKEGPCWRRARGVPRLFSARMPARRLSGCAGLASRGGILPCTFLCALPERSPRLYLPSPVHAPMTLTLVLLPHPRPKKKTGHPPRPCEEKKEARTNTSPPPPPLSPTPLHTSCGAPPAPPRPPSSWAPPCWSWSVHPPRSTPPPTSSRAPTAARSSCTASTSATSSSCLSLGRPSTPSRRPSCGASWRARCARFRRQV